MAIAFIQEWYGHKYDPCRLCLVKVTCNLEQRVKCGRYHKHIKYYTTIGKIDDFFDAIWILGILVGGLLFVITTFAFGIWKWFELWDSIWNGFRIFASWIGGFF